MKICLCQSHMHAFQARVSETCIFEYFIKFISWVLEAYTEGKACTRCLLEAKEPKNQIES